MNWVHGWSGGKEKSNIFYSNFGQFSLPLTVPYFREVKLGDEGETLHYLHPDGTVTVQFISADEVGDAYITDADGQQQFIATDESGEYITTATGAPAQYILAIDSDGQIIATGPPEEFITADPEDGFEEEAEVEHLEDELEHEEDEVSNLMVELEGDEEEEVQTQIEEVLDGEEEDGEVPQTTDSMQTQEMEALVHEQQEVIPEKEEQERQRCANCFCKLIFQRGRSKKFTDKLYPLKEFPSLHPQKKHAGKEVTVLEAMDLLFDLKQKSSSVSIKLCEDYIFCFKCVSSLSKLHTLFVEFTEASTSPSFMKSIFGQYGVLNEFSNAIREIKQESQPVNQAREPLKSSAETVEEISIDSQRRKEKTKTRLVSNEVISEVTPTPPTTSPIAVKKKTDHLSKTIRKSPEHGRKVKIKIEETPIISECSRLPRSCKKRQDYRALAKGGHDSDVQGDDDNGEDVNSPIVDDEESVASVNAESSELIDKMPLKKRASRLLKLKNRIKEITESPKSETPVVVKRKRGRPRKTFPTVTPELRLKLERIETTDEPRPTKKLEVLENATLTWVDDNESETEQSRPTLTPKPKREVGLIEAEEDLMEADDDFGDEDEEATDATNNTSASSRNVRKSIKCTKCCATFVKQSHYIDHLRVHTESNLSCLECHGTFNTSRNLKRHISLNHKVRQKKVPLSKQFTCPECNFSFTRKFHLKGHLVNQHQLDPDTVLGDFPCPVCGRKNYTEASLQAHLVRKHLVRIREKKHKCEECGMRFLKKSDMENHTTTHTNIRRFMCDICGFCSKRPQDLTRHRKLVHLKEVKHMCSTCGKGFLSLWQMKAHQLSHDEYKGFPCPEPGCGKSFRCPNNLRQHIHVHQGVKHVCQYCGESYSRTAYLARHIKVNHLGIEVPSKRTKRAKETNHHELIIRSPKIKKAKRTYEILDPNTMDSLQPEPLELDIDIPTEDGHTQQVILHGFDDRYEGVIMEYIIG